MHPVDRAVAPRRRRVSRSLPHLLLPVIALAFCVAPHPAMAQPAPPRDAPAEVERPGPAPERRGGGPTGDDIIEDNEERGIARGVIRPPLGVDPGIQGRVPEPMPNTTPVIPPPGTPGGNPLVIPR
jgi:hypothetical protein